MTTAFTYFLFQKYVDAQEPAQQSRRRRLAHDSERGADRISNVYQYEHLYQKCAEAKCAL